MNVGISIDERIDDLQYKGLRIIQKREGFRFGIDAVLLANFTKVRKNQKVIDLGTGTGIISILIAAKNEPGIVKGIEIQQDMVEMAQRSVKLNRLDEKINIIHADIKEAVDYFGSSSFDVVVTNPPYMNRGGGLLNSSDKKALSRHELLCTLEDVVRVSSKLLVPGGLFSMVHRPDRLVDIVFLMRSHGIEPKQLRFVHPAPYKKPNLMLINGARGGRPQLKMMDPLYVYDEKGCYSEEINEIYQREVKTVD